MSLILVYFTCFFLFCLECITCSIESQTCPSQTNCLNTNFCQTRSLFYSEEFELGKELSESTCFHESDLNFTMGTSNPVFISDGEGPPRKVHLSPFCIDQTEVSNAQFYQFVLKTNYVTEVLYDHNVKLSISAINQIIFQAEKNGDSFCLYKHLSENMKSKFNKAVI